MPLFRSPLIVLDTETTGFPKHPWAGVCELGAVFLDEEGQEMSSFSALCRPPVLDDRALPALAINHITMEEILAAEPSDEVAEDFRHFANGSYVTSFNVGFDRQMCERMGIKPPWIRGWASCIMLRATAIMDEAGALPRWDDGSPKWAKLEEAAAYFGVQVQGDAHRALTDARTAARIAIEIRRAGR